MSTAFSPAPQVQDGEALAPMKVGIIGCGNISPAYFNAARTFPMLEVVACADINMDAARRRAEKYGVRALTVEELLAMDEIEAVINLTIPNVHAEVTLQALQGASTCTAKNRWRSRAKRERPSCRPRKRKTYAWARPDTFLGPAYKHAEKVLDDGWIGRPWRRICR